MKKGISVMMSFVIIVALGFIGGNVKAETHATEEEYRVVYSSEPNMNPGYIKALAERQNPQMLMEKSKEGDVQYEASQLVEVREYTDGSIEKDYAVSKLAETTAANTSTAFSQSRGNYSLNLTMYYTVKGTSRNYTYNLTKIQSTVVKMGIGGVTVTSGSHAYRLNKSTFNRQPFYFNNSALTGGQVFTLSTGSTSFYPSYPDLLTASVSGIYADSIRRQFYHN